MAYMVAKDAIRTFTRYVAFEEKEFNVCVVAMGPGATIATEEAPEEARARMPGVEVVGNRFVLAAEASMELSGQALNVEDGKLVGRP
jgi:NAD(P)-dependent dehydrogenase (short-subunit alcohol dehydrogenase family)